MGTDRYINIFFLVKQFHCVCERVGSIVRIVIIII